MRRSAIWLSALCVLLAACGGTPPPQEVEPRTPPTPPLPSGPADAIFEAELESFFYLGVESDAHGQATATLRGDVLTVEGSFEGLSSAPRAVAGSAAHIRVGPFEDEDGPILYNLEVTPTGPGRGTLSGTFEVTPEQVFGFQSGAYYVNVHSERYPKGELRGTFGLPGDGDEEL